MCLGLAADRRDFSVATNAMSGLDNPGPLLARVGSPLYRRPYSGWLQDKDRSASIQQGQGERQQGAGQAAGGIANRREESVLKVHHGHRHPRCAGRSVIL